MFVEATPGDKLLKILKETEEKYKIADDMRIKFVAKSGIKLKDILQKKNPLETNCDDNKCHICKNKMGNSKCRKNNIVYTAKCDKCENMGVDRLYHGETARNVYARSKEHYSALKSQNKNNFMYKHIKKEHAGNGEDITFS